MLFNKKEKKALIKGDSKFGGRRRERQTSANIIRDRERKREIESVCVEKNVHVPR